MSTRQFQRRARLVGPALAGCDVLLEPPPELTRASPPSVLVTFMPVVMVAGMVGCMVITGEGATSLLMGGMMAMSMVGMLVNGAGRRGGAAAAVDDERMDYLRYLARIRTTIRNTAIAQRAAQDWTHPDPEALSGIARSPRLWERRRSDPDFGQVRIGRGPQRLATALIGPSAAPGAKTDSLSELAVRRLVRAHMSVRDLPITFDLRAFPVLSLLGDDPRGLARAILVQACTMHGPADFVVAVVTAAADRKAWEWVKWLPHAQHPTASDALGRVRMITSSRDQMRAWLGPQLANRPRFTEAVSAVVDGPHVVIVLDDRTVTEVPLLAGSDGLAGVTVLDLNGVTGDPAARGGLQLTCSAGRVGTVTTGSIEWLGTADQVSAQLAESIARSLAPWQDSAGASPADRLAGAAGLMDLLEPGDGGSFDFDLASRARPVRDRLRIPIGVGRDGIPVELDLKEAALGGMGPHGLIIGATGSGKSEVLRTVVLGLAVTHSSAALNFVLVDFKGGATFLGLQELPHVAAVITNLSDDLSMVDRMRDALAGEMNRRQELLRDAGNFASVRDYEHARENGADLEPLPALLIVCDEFTELLMQKPDFAELFVAIGRLGRSLAMHLLLASQRLEEGRMRGLDSHLSYRIGLKTFSAAESRAVLDVPDAYELPSVPGSAFLKFGATPLVPFKAACVSGVFRPTNSADGSGIAADRRARLFISDIARPMERWPAASPPRRSTTVGRVERSVLDVIVSRMVGHGPPARELWLPPLTTSPTLDELLPPIGVSDRGLRVLAQSFVGRLQAPIALLDRPFEQRRDPLWVDFAGASGHGIVVGGPQSGKSNLLRSIVSALSLTNTPTEVQFYCVDLGGGALSALVGLPHLGEIATGGDPEVVRRMIVEMATIVVERARRFRQLGIESMAACRAMRTAVPPPEGQCADVFLVIDGWESFRGEFAELEPQVVALTQQGLAYGVHVILAANRWAEIRPAMKDMITSRFELRLGDPSESEIDRRAAADVPAGRPGRGLSSEKLHFLTALPRIDGVATPTADLAAGVAAMVAAHQAAWTGATPSRVRLLPDLLPVERLPTPAQDDQRRGIPIAISEATLSPVYQDFATDPHLLILGDSGSGKTSFLRTLGHQIAGRYTSEEARFLVVDYRRTLLQALPDKYLAGCAAGAAAATGFIADVVTLLRSRVPGPDVTPDQLRTRSWWTGAELFVLVDDYDLVQVPSGNPLVPLLEFLPQARDVGLHLVLCRRAGGAARSMYEPVMQCIRDLGSPGVLMSGPRDEGVLLGTLRPTSLPPGRGYLVSRRDGQQLVQLAFRV